MLHEHLDHPTVSASYPVITRFLISEVSGEESVKVLCARKPDELGDIRVIPRRRCNRVWILAHVLREDAILEPESDELAIHSERLV